VVSEPILTVSRARTGISARVRGGADARASGMHGHGTWAVGTRRMGRGQERRFCSSVPLG
jgi:hypothetical protein